MGVLSGAKCPPPTEGVQGSAVGPKPVQGFGCFADTTYSCGIRITEHKNSL